MSSGTIRTSASRMPWSLSQVATCATFLSWVRPDRISSPITTSAAVQVLSNSFARAVELASPVRRLRAQANVGLIYGAMTQYITVAADDRVEARNGVIKLHGPEGFAGMRRAGRLAAEILDALVPHVVPGVSTQELDDIVYTDDGRGRRGSRDARLSRLHQELLHLDQPCRLPRHPGRQDAQGRRHRQHRRDPDRRRLARRHQPHVPRRRRAAEGAGSWSTSPTNA